MSCNIYEDPDQTMKARFSKEMGGKGQEAVEKVVDIYESVETCPVPRVNPSRKIREARTKKRRATVQRNPYKAVALTLGLLCLLLLVGISVLLVLYLSVHLKPEQPSWTCQQKQNQSNIEWQEFRVSHFYYASAEKKNWTESRKDCQSKGGDLVVINSNEEQEFVKSMKIHGDSWIGLQTREGPDWKMKWQWVDGSELIHSLWEKGVMSLPEAESKAYIDQRGWWMHNNTGQKHWICESRNVGNLA
ncbi:CD209 antigen-like protein D [Fundulus heteroclitus]|uniref:CD209 antigen-like protein D n=1 Tax=Fundulus heteroclitus TaxID=8078 RepID=UPI00165B9714|nr:CD209 antigen-like protein D [Fundulus heteroclitus]